MVTWKNCFRVGISIFILFIGIYYWKEMASGGALLVHALMPVFIGMAIAYVLNILMSFYEKHYFVGLKDKKWVKGSKRPVCLVGAIVSLIAAATLIIWLVVPEFISCIKFLVAETIPTVEDFFKSDRLSKIIPENVRETISNIDLKTYLKDAASFLGTGVGSTVKVLISAITSIFSTIFTVLISIIFSVYLLADKEKLQRQCYRLLKNYMPERFRNKILHCLKVLDECFHKYIVGQCLEAVILGVLCTVGMLIFRFPYAGMVGAFIGFTAIIPIAGAYIGAVVGAIMIMTVSPVKALLFIVFITVLQQLEENLIYPRVVGKAISLPAIWVLAAITVGGSLMGVLGMLIGVPIAAAAYRLLKEDMNRRESNDVISR
ncbi:MAG: AI-2E family transporter [Lachnospiraceae bacterium]|nr:AI-2E family transporter [Lachnospiraceae bacterium]